MLELARALLGGLPCGLELSDAGARLLVDLLGLDGALLGGLARGFEFCDARLGGSSGLRHPRLDGLVGFRGSGLRGESCGLELRGLRRRLFERGLQLGGAGLGRVPGGLDGFGLLPELGDALPRGLFGCPGVCARGLLDLGDARLRGLLRFRGPRLCGEPRGVEVRGLRRRLFERGLEDRGLLPDLGDAFPSCRFGCDGVCARGLLDLLGPRLDGLLCFCGSRFGRPSPGLELGRLRGCLIEGGLQFGRPRLGRGAGRLGGFGLRPDLGDALPRGVLGRGGVRACRPLDLLDPCLDGLLRFRGPPLGRLSPGLELGRLRRRLRECGLQLGRAGLGRFARGVEGLGLLPELGHTLPRGPVGCRGVCARGLLDLGDPRLGRLGGARLGRPTAGLVGRGLGRRLLERGLQLGGVGLGRLRGLLDLGDALGRGLLSRLGVGARCLLDLGDSRLRRALDVGRPRLGGLLGALLDLPEAVGGGLVRGLDRLNCLLDLGRALLGRLAGGVELGCALLGCLARGLGGGEARFHRPLALRCAPLSRLSRGVQLGQVGLERLARLLDLGDARLGGLARRLERGRLRRRLLERGLEF